MTVRILQGDCRAVMATLPEDSVDAIVCDPPYELGFMGKGWDRSGVANDVETWRQALRVLKPGGHLLAFSGTRTYHRMVCAIEDAGFEVRDQIGWLYGSGFPKSLDVSKAIDKARDDTAAILRVTSFMADAAERAGITRADVDAAMGTSDMGGWWLSRLQHRCQCPKWDQWLRLKVLLSLPDDMDAEVWRLNGRKGTPGNERHDREVSGPAGNEVFQPTQRVINPGTPVLDAARQWAGWGTALKPAWEPVCVARKPLAGTVAANVLQHGTGALNIDGCRVEFQGDADKAAAKPGGKTTAASGNLAGKAQGGAERAEFVAEQGAGRWPANVIHDGSDEVLAAFPYTESGAPGIKRGGNTGAAYGAESRPPGTQMGGFGDAGSAARFFYTAKASGDDRNEGVKGLLTWESVDLSPVTESLRELARVTSDAMTLLQDGPEWSTSPSGNSTTARSLRAIRSITETASRTTTESRTSKSSPPWSTSESIRAAIATARASGSSLAELAEFTSWRIQSSTDERTASVLGVVRAALLTLSDASRSAKSGNVHSTVKPTELMRYLCRLVTPPGGVVLDPFMGSGSTLKAAELEGFDAIGIELDPSYIEIARRRIAADAPLFADVEVA